ncbi:MULTISPECIES: hypothetical protein [Spirulina sp. CCY15215]|uniref:hypothetical protein n=1 Tax=Spirulina sp. CCY15215 TaxID=2767591 RepID=UPI0019529ADB|nr:hypothetical protein [Spirulina major]
MKTLKKIVAGICLTFGIGLSILMLADMINSENSSEDKGDAFAALMLLGLPTVVLGGGLVWNLQHQHRQMTQKLLLQQEQLFLALLQKQEGRITEIEFATEAKISLEEAKVYLDRKATALNGDFEETEKGAIIYQFPLR